MTKTGIFAAGLAAAAFACAAAPAAAQNTSVPDLGAPVPAPAEAAAPAAAAPEPVPAAAAAPEPECELHVWPAERFNSMTTGWLSGFGAVGAVIDSASNADKDAANRTKMASALDQQGQLEALNSLPLVKLLAAKPAKIVVHDETLDRKTINKIKTRRAQSASTCYSELIVADVFYQKAALYGRSLRTLFMYRDFGAAADKPWIYKSWGGNGLKLFPAKEGEDVQAANDELVGVFKANFEEFANNARKAAARRR